MRRSSLVGACLVVTTMFAACWSVVAQSADADAATHGFLDRSLDGSRYVVFVPQGEPPAEGWPVILFLHGAGERGRDGRRQVEVGIGPAVRKRAATFRGVVVFPQADFGNGPILETWRADEPGGKLATAILADVERQWSIDPRGRAIIGWSMGAYGALSLAAADPEHWTKVLAVSGGGEPDWGPALAKLPVWLVHGTADRIVPASESRAIVRAVPPPHNELTLTEVPGAGHDVWRSVYDNDAVLNWLLAPASAVPPVDTIVAPPPEERTQIERASEESFSPALVISRAVALRLGNEALATLAAGIPQAINEDGLHGELDPVRDEVEFDGRTFQVRFDQMSYQARLDRVLLAGQGPGRLQVAFALKDFVIRIGEIEVSDASDGVRAGPVSIVIGHREPVWMHLEVRPVATSGGALRLSLLRSQFAIPDWNWYVKPPETIAIRGRAFTKDAVTTAIVGGIYLRRETFESQILAAITPMLRQVEDRADFSPLSQLVTSLWPLPVYQPQLQMRLEETSTDTEGVSLVFGCAAAGIEPLPAGRPVPRVSASIPPASAMERSTGLSAAVAVDVMQHLSGLLAGTEAVTLYAADVPGRPFHELDDAHALVDELHETAADAAVSDVRSRMVLQKPFTFVPLPNADGEPSTVQMEIDVPDLLLSVFGKERAKRVGPQTAGGWTLLAERDLSIRQPFRLTTTTQLDGPTSLRIAWGEGVDVADRSNNGAGRHPDGLTQRFRQGWTRWAESQQQLHMELPDVAVGSARLRLDQFVWEGESLAARFRPAATVLINPTDRAVAYCVRSDASRWSDRLTLPPHTEHVFRMGVTLQIRDADRWSPGGQRLAPGEYLWTAITDDAGRHWRVRPAASAAKAETN